MAATVYLVAPTTPPDYHRIISPTLQVPLDPQVSIPVGLLGCQRTVNFWFLYRLLLPLTPPAQVILFSEHFRPPL